MKANKPRYRESGFTLIELIAVIGVITVIVALLVPAVLSARESARRIQCVANIKQLGIGLNLYHIVHGMFTPSQLKTSKNTSSSSYSELVFLLPYVEQEVLFNSINMEFNMYEWSENPVVDNRTARQMRLGIFLCPSDGEPFHTVSYRFNRGKMGGKGEGTGADGPFNIRVLPTQAAITDGLAQTAFVSERIGGNFSSSRNSIPRDIKVLATSKVMFRSDSRFVPICLENANEWVGTAGRFWMYGGNCDTHYNHVGTPNDQRATCLNLIGNDNGFGINPPRSYHSGSVNVLFGDGHCDSVTNTVDLHTWTAIGTHASGD